MQRKYNYSSRSAPTVDLVELKSAFEVAEKSSPGISDYFIKEIIHKLVPGFSETRINNLLDKMTR